MEYYTKNTEVIDKMDQNVSYYCIGHSLELKNNGYLFMFVPDAAV